MNQDSVPEVESEQWYTIKDLSNETGIHQKQIRKMIRNDNLPYYQRSKGCQIYIPGDKFEEWKNEKLTTHGTIKNELNEVKQAAANCSW